MTTTSLRNLRLAAAVAWLAVGACGVWELLVESGDDWELSYTIYTAVLCLGTAFTVVWLASVLARRGLRVAALAVAGLGAAATFVGAWALPLWMSLLGVGLTLLALATSGPARRTITILAAAQFLGMATQFGTLALGADEDLASGLAWS